jgi:hypothetical protein
VTFVNSSSTGSGNPVFDYSSRDYASVLTDLVARIPVYLPEWTSQSASDFGIVMLQMFAYSVDILSYYLDRLAGEAFIQTATQPSSILNLAAMLDYTPTLSTGSTVTLQILISSALSGGSYPFTIPQGTLFSTPGSSTQAPIVFQTTESLTIIGPNLATPSYTGSVSAVQGTTYTSLPQFYNAINLWTEFGIPSTATIIPTTAISNGTVNQSYGLQYTPVSADSFTVYVDLGTGPNQWTYAQSLIDYGPDDQVYTNYVDANGIFYIQFGDGVNGLVPPLGSPIYVTYNTNVGATGNVGAGTITSTVNAFPGIVAVTNPASASGGTAAESIASIQTNAPASLKTLNRAVTISDWSTLGIQVAGVQWAAAIEETYQLVNLYIAPFGGGAPSTLLMDQVLDYIVPLSMANTTVTILSPTYVPINITVEVVVLPTFGNSSTETLVATALANLLALSNTGFGFRVALGDVYTTILEQSGVNYAIVNSLTRIITSSALLSTTAYTSISITEPLSVQINIGDILVLNPGETTTLQVTVSQTAVVGSTSISTNSFTPITTFPSGTGVQDLNETYDVVTLNNEIPIAGTFTLNVSGGLQGS